MTEPGLVAGVDIGTTGVKVAAVDAAASLVRVTQVLHPDPDDARSYRALLPAFARTGEAVEDLHHWSRDGWLDDPAGTRAGRPVEQDAG
jgi:sugar (pentulose or hexulose) kinase